MGSGGGEDDIIGRAIDLRTTCPVYQDLGYCPYGWKCRFLGGHVKRAVEGDEGNGGVRSGGWVMGCETVKEEEGGWKGGETNWPAHQIFAALRRCTVCSTPSLINHSG